ncbi:hypothetical protein HNQ02_003632 [Flavobacterium sp. 7E]|uniref:hypothetical protein n=1 Tax=Flavobacterium sp. 7E TaxID=2735898 RepID=UPI0015701F0D|nr:hypothetical protein [Flavobacterium sp. 7E]NRS90685.1 hypothetical protein [Flavobacterium sp. 7E]
MMKNLLLFLFLTFYISSKSQSISVIKDSVLINSSYFLIEELKIDLKDEFIKNKIYNTTQSAFDIFNISHSKSPEQRIRMKKDTITSYLQQNHLREENVGFEHFEIYYYNKNNILNLSISIQSYGSAFESIQYFCFDLVNGNNIGKELFTNQKRLLEEVKVKLNLENQDLKISLNDLMNYKIISVQDNSIIGIDFILFDTENYRNGGYEEFVIHFSSNEIKKYISPNYCKKLSF